MAIPAVTIIGIDKPKLSDEVGFQTANLSFSFDINVIAYTVRCNGTSPQTGIDCESRDKKVLTFAQNYSVIQLSGLSVLETSVFPANSEIIAEIHYSELYQEGENRINVYGQDPNLEWSIYDSGEIIEPPPPPPPATEILTLDFKNKTTGNTTTNPHFSAVSGLVYYPMPTPTEVKNVGIEATDVLYQKISIEENNSSSPTYYGYLVNRFSEITWYFKFDILKVLEDKYGIGVWNGATTTADKMIIAKQKIISLKFHHHGHGERNPSGADGGLFFAVWKGNGYTTPVFIANGTDSYTFSTKEWEFSKVDIGNDGFIHLITYTVLAGDEEAMQIVDYACLYVEVDNN